MGGYRRYRIDGGSRFDRSGIMESATPHDETIATGAAAALMLSTLLGVVGTSRSIVNPGTKVLPNGPNYVWHSPSRLEISLHGS